MAWVELQGERKFCGFSTRFKGSTNFLLSLKREILSGGEKHASKSYDFKSMSKLVHFRTLNRSKDGEGRRKVPSMIL